jgi:3-phosphoshikimate 1-carboxyvinyltransferase
MGTLRVRPAQGPLKGTLTVPGDKSISHRALLFAGIASGTSILRGVSGGLDNLATARALESMGARYESLEDGALSRVTGVGLDGLRMPSGAIDCGNSGTTMRMIAGLLVAQEFGTRLVGDASLSRRPMRRIVDPLRARGGHIAGQKGKKEGEHYPPLSVAPLVPGEKLTGIEFRSPVASAQVKSALLLSGLWADGPTIVAEPTLSRDHTERMLRSLDVPLETAGPMVALDPSGWNRVLPAFEWTVPGDLSSAAFLLAAGLMVRGSSIEITGVGTNPTRTGFLDVLRSMRASIEVVPKGEAAGSEPVGDLFVQHGSLGPARVGGELVTRMIDEVPVLAALLATIPGKHEIRDAEELRVKESDRIATMASVLRAFGGDCTELEDGLIIHGGGRLTGATVSSDGDHRIAMSAALLGLCAEGETVIEDADCIDTSFPNFVEILTKLGAEITRA